MKLKLILAALIVLGGVIFIVMFAFLGSDSDDTALEQTLDSEETAAGQKEIAAPLVLEQQPYSNAQYGFSIKPPSGWQPDESGATEPIVRFSNTELDYEQGRFLNANINVASESAQELSLDDIVNANIEALRQFFSDYQLVGIRHTSVGELPAKLLESMFTRDDFRVKSIQLAVVKDNQVYVVTAASLESYWARYQNLFESSLSTFTLH